MNGMIAQAAALLEGMGIQWAVCGGFALELFTGRAVRQHGDIDVCVFEADRDRIPAYMMAQGWRVYEFRGQGRLRPLYADDRSDAGRNLMCLQDGCALVQFYPCDEPGMLLHMFDHRGIERLDYIEFLFNCAQDGEFVFDGQRGVTRELARAILHRDGVPYLAPELALLYKAAQPDRDENRCDWEQEWPLLDAEQRGWLRESLAALYPDGHAWMDELRG